jgi:hypothetical protein
MTAVAATLGASIPALVYAGTRSWAALTIESRRARITVFNIETLSALGARLFDHADSITNPARHDMEVDCPRSKYPPAKPVALICEPLEAAMGSLTRPH